MAPDISYHLTNEEFDHFVERLQQYGVAVCDTSRGTNEDVGRGCMRSEEYRGTLVLGKNTFKYRRHKTFPCHLDHLEEVALSGIRSHPNVNVFTTYFSVDWIEHDPKDFEQLADILELAFPQPKRPVTSLPRQHPKTWSQICRKAGCFLLLLMWFAACFFLIFGIYQFFHVL